MGIFSRLQLKKLQEPPANSHSQAQVAIKGLPDNETRARIPLPASQRGHSLSDNRYGSATPSSSILQATKLDCAIHKGPPAESDRWDENGDLDQANTPLRMKRMFRRRPNTATTTSVTGFTSEDVGEGKKLERASLVPTRVTDYVKADDPAESSSRGESTQTPGLKSALLRSTSRTRAMTTASSWVAPPLPTSKKPSLSKEHSIPEETSRLVVVEQPYSLAKSVSSPFAYSNRPMTRTTTSEDVTMKPSSSISIKPPVRRSKSSKLSRRPATASAAPLPISIDTYIQQISPPPRGLPIALFDARKNSVVSFVRIAATQDVNTQMKAMESTMALDLSRSPSLRDFDRVMKRLEEGVYQSMQDALDQGIAAAQYREIRLADVFIEARRDLNLESMSMRLHDLFDLLEVRDAVNLSKLPLSSNTSKEPSGVGSLGWDSNALRVPPSLSPAPRRRRPRMSPLEQMNKAGTFHRKDSNILKEQTVTPDLSYSVSPFLDGSSTPSNERLNAGQINTRRDFSRSSDKEESRYIPSTSGFTNRLPYITPNSLPPSPPRSIESHASSKTATVVDEYTLLKHHQRMSGIKRVSSSHWRPIHTSQDVTFEIMPDDESGAYELM